MSIDDCNGCRSEDCDTCVARRYHAKHKHCLDCQRCLVGEKDAGIPLGDVETIRAKQPDLEVHVYPGAQHGFSCDERASYDKASADIAWHRTLAFFAKHLTT